VKAQNCESGKGGYGRFAGEPPFPVHIQALIATTTSCHCLIRMNDEQEVKYWTKHLKVERDVLEQVVEKVGNSAPTVRKELEVRAKGE
jgi:hypothetical protein